VIQADLCFAQRRRRRHAHSRLSDADARSVSTKGGKCQPLSDLATQLKDCSRVTPLLLVQCCQLMCSEKKLLASGQERHADDAGQRDEIEQFDQLRSTLRKVGAGRAGHLAGSLIVVPTGTMSGLANALGLSAMISPMRLIVPSCFIAISPSVSPGLMVYRRVAGVAAFA